MCPRSYRAVDRVILGVEPGEVLGCLGSDGASKATALKLLPYQLVSPTGAVAIFPQLSLFLFPDGPQLLGSMPS